jgi:hypothetical protein
MPTNRITMRQIRESLRLHLQANLSYNEVGRNLKISKSVVGKYMSLARVAGVDWSVAQTLSDQELEAKLYKAALPRNSKQALPDFAQIHTALKRAGVTLQLLWEEYAKGNDLAFTRSTLITSQLPVKAWHTYLDDPTLADAILDRVVHSSHRIDLKGATLRDPNTN